MYFSVQSKYTFSIKYKRVSALSLPKFLPTKVKIKLFSSLLRDFVIKSHNFVLSLLPIQVAAVAKKVGRISETQRCDPGSIPRMPYFFHKFVTEIFVKRFLNFFNCYAI